MFWKYFSGILVGCLSSTLISAGFAPHLAAVQQNCICNYGDLFVCCIHATEPNTPLVVQKKPGKEEKDGTEKAASLTADSPTASGCTGRTRPPGGL